MGLTRITDSDVATANLDGTTATPSMRTLGTGAQQSAAGDDTRITGAAQKAANLSDLASASTARNNLGLGTMATQGAGAVAITGGTITGTTVDGISVKAYIDQFVEGIQWKATATVVSLVNVTIATLADGSTVAGYVVGTGETALLAGQTDQTENGVYDIHASGPATRRADMSTGAEIAYGVVPIATGTGASNEGKIYRCNQSTVVLGSTNITFSLLPVGVGALIAANNLSDLTSASTARTNLGLGTLATQSGTFSGTSSGTNTGDQTLSGLGGVAAADIIDGETPAGTMNGSNPTFTLANTPVAGSVKLYLRGVRLRSGAGNDYTISGGTITMLTGKLPQSGDNFLADYRK